MASLFCHFGHLQQWVYANLLVQKLAKVGLKFCQILSKPSKIAKAFIVFDKFWQKLIKSGHTVYHLYWLHFDANP